MPGLVYQLGSGGEERVHLGLNTAAARARRAANKRAQEEDNLLEDEHPAHAHASSPRQDLPLLDLSVTLSKSKGHINPAWLTLVYEWMKLRCKAGAVAAERGGKAQHLHLQIILRMCTASMDIDALKLELKTLVGWQRGDGSGCYCSAKEFGAGQEPKTNSM